MRRFWTLSALLLAGCAAPPPAPVRPAADFLAATHGGDLPFADSVKAGDYVFLSGEIGTAPGTTALVAGGLGPETRQTMENVKAKLLRRGLTMDDVVKCTVFLADSKDWAAFNEVYRTYFPKRFPARSALGANGLALGARVEVECVAYAPTR
jgi:reactive intermediate/imine deaminase